MAIWEKATGHGVTACVRCGLSGSVEQVGRGLAWRNSCVGHGSVVAAGRRHGCAAMHVDVCMYAER